VFASLKPDSFNFPLDYLLMPTLKTNIFMARQKCFSANNSTNSQSWFLSWSSPLAIITVSGQASSPGRSCDRQSRSALQTCSSRHAWYRCGQDTAEETPGTGNELGRLPNHPVCIGKSISLTHNVVKPSAVSKMRAATYIGYFVTTQNNASVYSDALRLQL
jgi:hypothetical protein